RRPTGDNAIESGGEAFVERDRPFAIDTAGGELLLPSQTKGTYALEQIGGRLERARRSRLEGARRSRLDGALRGSVLHPVVRRWLDGPCPRRERLERGAHGFARRHPLGARDVVPLCVAGEKAIACAAEPLPERFRSAFLYRADGPPLR